MAYPSNRPDKQPIVKTPVTDGQYASFVDRVIACREAEDRAKEDTKALYAEIAAAGEDKTYIGLVVRGLRLSNKDRVKAEIRDAAVEEGRARYRRGKASHVRAREGSSESTTPNTSNSGADSAKSTAAVTTPHDPVTGEIIEDNEPAPASKEAVAAAGGEGGIVASVALPADTQSTAARTGRAGQPQQGADAYSPATDARDRASGYQAPPVDTLPIRQDEPVDAVVDGPQTVDGRRNSEPVRGQSGAKPDSAGAPAAEGGGAGASASSAVPKLKMNPEFFNAPHPACQRPSFCGGNSNLALCEDCKVAAGRASANDDFAQVEMRGTIN